MIDSLKLQFEKRQQRKKGHRRKSRHQKARKKEISGGGWCGAKKTKKQKHLSKSRRRSNKNKSKKLRTPKRFSSEDSRSDANSDGILAELQSDIPIVAVPRVRNETAQLKIAPSKNAAQPIEELRISQYTEDGVEYCRWTYTTSYLCDGSPQYLYPQKLKTYESTSGSLSRTIASDMYEVNNKNSINMMDLCYSSANAAPPADGISHLTASANESRSGKSSISSKIERSTEEYSPCPSRYLKANGIPYAPCSLCPNDTTDSGAPCSLCTRLNNAGGSPCDMCRKASSQHRVPCCYCTNENKLRPTLAGDINVDRSGGNEIPVEPEPKEKSTSQYQFLRDKLNLCEQSLRKARNNIRCLQKFYALTGQKILPQVRQFDAETIQALDEIGKAIENQKSSGSIGL
ncbi:hypothetical protein AB6A40_003036 [Gnathostoma spinigerum]|uniref:Uncharacterized protein n=1 Tax=Gnathostoma spinigerum TaxID=75299 RepID=A0ABD6EIC9_9BILA